MRGVRVERNVRQYADLVGVGRLDCPDCLTHQIIGIGRLFAAVASFIGGCIGEQRDAGDAKRNRLAGALDDQIYRPARYAGQRCNGFLDVFTAGNE